jgi:hypothetical protein
MLRFWESGSGGRRTRYQVAFDDRLPRFFAGVVLFALNTANCKHMNPSL